MKVLVTGGIGNVGTAVIERFRASGHTVRVIGRKPRQDAHGAEYGQCDITEIDCLLGHVKGMDAIIHLAALSGPHLGTPETVFRINCQGTFNVYEAAAKAGIRRVVTASSINALGFGMGVRDFRVDYFPVDEDHPTFPTDAYSFSKNVTEEIADYYWRREGISGCCLRIPATVPFPGYEEGPARDFRAQSLAEAKELLALDPAGRRKKYDGWMAGLAEQRRNRWAENPPKNWQGTFPGELLIACRADLWTALDARDSAQAFEKAMTKPYEGSHVLFVNDGCNRTGVPVRTLAELFYPAVATWKRPVKDTESLVSIDRARSFLGYEPEYPASRFFA